jgi:putative resolvase
MVVNLTERARLRGTDRQTGYCWFGDGWLPVPAVRVDARTVLIAPDAVLALVVQGGPAGRRGCHRMTRRLTRAGRSKTRLLADRVPVTVVAERQDRPGRLNTGLAGAALAAHGRRLGRDRAANALRCAARHAGPSRPGAA